MRVSLMNENERYVIDRFHIDIDRTRRPMVYYVATYNGIHGIATMKITYQVSCTDENNCIDYCFNADCGAGKCINDPESSSSTCECPDSHLGAFCNVYNYCNNVDCNNGTCINNATMHTCECNPGFSGPACDVHACSDYCMHRGLCVINSSHPTCSCPDGYVGKRCEMKRLCFNVYCGLDDCVSSVLECQCNSASTDIDCTYTDHCFTNQLVCIPNGKCKNGMDSGSKNLAGMTCNATDTCMNESCIKENFIDSTDSSTCYCKPGLSNSSCELMDHCLDIDLSYGIWLNSTGNFSCECEVNVTNKLCDAESGECVSISRNTDEGELFLDEWWVDI